MLTFLTATTLLPVPALLLQLYWLGMRVDDQGAPELSKDEMRKHLLWYMFYVNPDDPRGWVPKIWGWGWTVNFRNVRQVLVFMALVGVCLISALLMTWVALGH